MVEVFYINAPDVWGYAIKDIGDFWYIMHGRGTFALHTKHGVGRRMRILGTLRGGCFNHHALGAHEARLPTFCIKTANIWSFKLCWHFVV